MLEDKDTFAVDTANGFVEWYIRAKGRLASLDSRSVACAGWCAAIQYMKSCSRCAHALHEDICLVCVDKSEWETL